MLDRPTQREFGQIVRKQLDYDKPQELSGSLEALLEALKDQADERNEPKRN